MSGIELALLVLRWLHVLSAIAMMGGAIFMRMALVPAAATLADDAHEQLRTALRARWAPVVMAAAGLLLLSGLANFGLTVAKFQFDKEVLPGRLYHMLFGVKFLLALPVLHIATLLVGRSETAQKARKNAKFWLTLNLVLATLVVCLGGVMRFAPRSPKQPASARLERVDQRQGELRFDAALNGAARFDGRTDG